MHQENSVHDHVLEFFWEGAVPLLCDIAQFALLHSCEGGEGDNPLDFHRLAASILATARVLAVNDDVVQALVAMGALKIVQKGLEVGIQRNPIEDNNETDKSMEEYLI
jgi:hypothetical protein